MGEREVEYRVNMTEDRDSWQQPYFLPAESRERADFLVKDARTWPNGKPRRWVEQRVVGPWSLAPTQPGAPRTDPNQGDADE